MSLAGTSSRLTDFVWTSEALIEARGDTPGGGGAIGITNSSDAAHFGEPLACGGVSMGSSGIAIHGDFASSYSWRRTKRNPRRLLLCPGLSELRKADLQCLALLAQQPPRLTRSTPTGGPDGSVEGTVGYSP